MKIKKNKKNGFTIIEILIAVFIIGLIVTLASISINKIREKGRDIKRVDNIKQIQLALEMYRRDVGSYPETLNFGEQLVNPSNSNIVYLDKIPTNLFYGGGDCPNEEYSYSLTDGKYEIEFCLENSQTEIESGYNCATISGISNGECFQCGSLLIYQEQSYETVQIGDQCWMAENLDSGIIINGGVLQSDNYITEKYCYNNTESNCGIYGGLYQWNEAINHNTSTTQGICPTGWHVPTYDDFTILSNYLGGILISGEKLKASSTDPIPWDGTNSSNFTALPAGVYSESWGTFRSFGSHTYFWSSSNYILNESQTFHLSGSMTSFSPGNINQAYGLSIRCLKN
jgi:uncharacterized protein (TIGR02145 family)/prepilin-type N-terminal cleavage/methylation domain-containing protein